MLDSLLIVAITHFTASKSAWKPVRVEKNTAGYSIHVEKPGTPCRVINTDTLGNFLGSTFQAPPQSVKFEPWNF